MANRVKLACIERIDLIGLERILPTRTTEKGTLASAKGQCIRSSIEELGLIEPLVVYPQDEQFFTLLDGHIRLAIIKELKWRECKCLVANDDEAFTYNHKVSRLASIQEHFMIMRAIENGVSEARIAKTLNVDVARIRQKRNLLDGICPEAVTLLKETDIHAGALRELRRVKPMRQIEIADLMCTMHNHSENYAKCLVAASSDDQLVDSERPKELRGLSQDELTKIEMETTVLCREFKLIEESHGKNMLHLTVASTYLKKLLDSARVVRYLSQKHPELLAEFQKIVESRSLAEQLPEAS